MPEQTWDDPYDDRSRHRLWRRLSTAVAELDPPPGSPVAVVDLDAFDANALDLTARAAGTPVRVASKSLRVRALVERALATEGFAGVLGYVLVEALHLVAQGSCDDVVVAYPTTDRAALGRLLRSPAALAAVTLMVDDPAHLDLVDAVRAAVPAAERVDAPVRVALDLDAGLHLRGSAGPTVGPRRSPLRTPEAAAALARDVLERRTAEGRAAYALVGAMTYEGQVAGVPDDVPGQRARSLAVRALKRRSLDQLADRRRAVAQALADAGARLEWWNGGGSGSVAESAADPVVTEVAAGSGLLVPALFDHYRSFRPRPAAYVGVPVTRRPDARTVTVHGGGLVASGAAGPDRLPLPWAPPGLRLTGLEGAGEVQTPLVGEPAGWLRIGDLVWLRHAKSGEPFEHVAVVHLVQGDRVVATVPTYRGEGLAG